MRNLISVISATISNCFKATILSKTNRLQHLFEITIFSPDCNLLQNPAGVLHLSVEVKTDWAMSNHGHGGIYALVALSKPRCCSVFCLARLGLTNVIIGWSCPNNPLSTTDQRVILGEGHALMTVKSGWESRWHQKFHAGSTSESVNFSGHSKL